ncbi:hypothetical protein KR054_011797 [Drosophila jambulina]|nr:hypothetical protein KR054_011797 [Drosophila jambulina]
MSSRSLNWNLVVSGLVLILAFVYSQGCGYGLFQCVEDGSCISNYNVCDSTPDCPSGSDESFTVCKRPLPENLKTHCANGAELSHEAKFCNRIVDCLDGSDELPQLCLEDTDWRSKYWGTCNGTGIECLPGECVSESKMCNDEIDCSNGLDESLEMCAYKFDSENFRCGNGKLIDEKLVCNNHMNCLDGSDELPSVCGGSLNWVPVEPKNCTEPKYREFTTNTKFIGKHSERFVYANQPVEVRCLSSNLTSWNVCMNTGKWHHEFPDCKPHRINRDPDTNGTNGCPIDYYNNETMLIVNERNEPVYPPLNNVAVKFVCLEGYEFLPYHLSGNPFICQKNKQWIKRDFRPSCVKLCPKEQINEMYALNPKCYGADRTLLTCTDQKSLIPGTIVEFACHPGFHHTTTNVISVTCTEDGTWEGIKDLCRNQEQLCAFDCNSRFKNSGYTLMKNGHVTNAMKVPWAVPIYLRNITTGKPEFQCTGNLIRLDMVLTAAHCVSNITNPSDVEIGTTGHLYASAKRFPAKHISVYPAFSNNTYKHDVAIISLQKRMKYSQGQKIICLPNESENIDLQGKEASMIAWSSYGTLSHVYGQISVPREHSGDFNVTLKENSKICKGDSGSGVITNCGNKMCLVGVISRTNTAGEVSTFCKEHVIAANIFPTYLMNFINASINASMHCLE